MSGSGAWLASVLDDGAGASEHSCRNPFPRCNWDKHIRRNPQTTSTGTKPLRTRAHQCMATTMGTRETKKKQPGRNNSARPASSWKSAMPKKEIGRQNTETKQHNLSPTTSVNQERRASNRKTSKDNKSRPANNSQCTQRNNQRNKALNKS